jgi:hypothetical protein
MTVEWMPVTEEGVEHGFPDDAKKSLCGRKAPRQLRLPVNLPKGTQCLLCALRLDKQAKEPLP